MNLSTLKSLERAAYRLVKILEKAEKANPELKEQTEVASNQWLAFYKRVQAAEDVIATKKDNGVSLFTVYMPQAYGLKVVERTPHRKITQWLYSDSGQPGYRYGTRDVDCNPLFSPEATFRQLNMPKEVAA